MKMDKGLFLLATATMAGTAVGTACSFDFHTGSNTPPNPSTSAPAVATAAPPAAPTATTPVSGHKMSGHVLGLKGTPIGMEDGGAPAPTPTPAAACLDSAAAPAVDCTQMTDKSCGWAQKRCAAYNQYLKPKVAQQASSCTTQSPTACGGAALSCSVTAMKSACADPQVATACQQLAAVCKDTVDNCTSILSSLNQTGQTQAAQFCSNPANCANGVGACVDAALFPAAEGGTAGTRPSYK